jgi:hypothetical protein
VICKLSCGSGRVRSHLSEHLSLAPGTRQRAAPFPDGHHVAPGRAGVAWNHPFRAGAARLSNNSDKLGRLVLLTSFSRPRDISSVPTSSVEATRRADVFGRSRAESGKGRGPAALSSRESEVSWLILTIRIECGRPV